MKLQTRVGVTKNSNGSEPYLRSTKSAALVTSQGHTEHEELTITGNSYIGANLGGTPVVTQAGLSATTPALTLYNPVGSGVNLVLNNINVIFTAAPAAACGIMLAYNLSSTTAPSTVTLANVTNAFLGTGKQPIGQCYRIATLGAAPLALRMLGGTAGAASADGYNLVDHVHGEIILAPGIAVSIQTTSAASILASFTWEEEEI